MISTVYSPTGEQVRTTRIGDLRADGIALHVLGHRPPGVVEQRDDTTKSDGKVVRSNCTRYVPGMTSKRLQPRPAISVGPGNGRFDHVAAGIEQLHRDPVAAGIRCFILDAVAIVVEPHVVPDRRPRHQAKVNRQIGVRIDGIATLTLMVFEAVVPPARSPRFQVIVEPATLPPLASTTATPPGRSSTRFVAVQDPVTEIYTNS